MNTREAGDIYFDLTFLHHLTIVPSVIVGDSDGILTNVPGVEPPVGWDDSASFVAGAPAPPASTAPAPPASIPPGEAEAATLAQSSPSSAMTAMRAPTYLKK